MLDEELAAEFGLVPLENGVPTPKPSETPTSDGGLAMLEEFLAENNAKTPAPVPPPAEESPTEETFLDRTLDRTHLAISDAMSTRFGDTYGRGGDEVLEKTDWIGPNAFSLERELATGADLARGIGDIASDAYETYMPKMAQRGIAKAVEAMGKNQDEHPIYGNVGIDSARADIEEVSPRLGAIADDAAIVGSMAAGMRLPKARTIHKAGRDVKNTLNMDSPDVPGDIDYFGDNVVKKSKDRLTNLRRQDIETRLQPDDIYGAPGKVKEEGFWKRDNYYPDENRARMYDDVEAVEGFNPRESPGNNWNALDAEVAKLRAQLDKDLRLEDYSPTSELKNSVEQSILDIQDLPVMTGDAASSAAKAVYAQVEKIINKHAAEGLGIKPGQMLDVRRELDGWLKLNDPKVFEGQTLSGTTLAVQAVRRAINNKIAEVAPDKNVLEALRHQSSLLTARDELLVKANRQGNNRLSRAVQQVQEALGLHLPHSPAAVGANTEFLPATIGLGGAAYVHGKRGAGNVLKPTFRGLEKAVAKGWDYGKGPLTAAAMNELQKEQENN